MSELFKRCDKQQLFSSTVIFKFKFTLDFENALSNFFFKSYAFVANENSTFIIVITVEQLKWATENAFHNFVKELKLVQNLFIKADETFKGWNEMIKTNKKLSTKLTFHKTTINELKNNKKIKRQFWLKQINELKNLLVDKNRLFVVKFFRDKFSKHFERFFKFLDFSKFIDE